VFCLLLLFSQILDCVSNAVAWLASFFGGWSILVFVKRAYEAPIKKVPAKKVCYGVLYTVW